MARDITIKYNQRVAYVGKTESGKTYFARHVLAPMPRLIVLDGKGTLNKPEWNLEMGKQVERNLLAGKDGRLRVPYPTNGDWRYWLDLAWRCQNITVYIDEMYAVVQQGNRAPNELVALYTRGRELGIGVQSATQRPSWVPKIMFTEAEWTFMFTLNSKADRKRVADDAGDPTLEEPIRDKHGFRTYTPRWRTSVYTSRYRPNSKTDAPGIGEVEVEEPVVPKPKPFGIGTTRPTTKRTG